MVLRPKMPTKKSGVQPSTSARWSSDKSPEGRELQQLFTSGKLKKEWLSKDEQVKNAYNNSKYIKKFKWDSFRSFWNRMHTDYLLEKALEEGERKEKATKDVGP